MTRNCTTAGALCVAIAATATATSAETLSVATHLPPTNFSVKHGLQPFMECVVQKNVGIDFQFFPSGQIATQKGALEALNSNLVQIASLSPAALTDSLPLTNVASLPNMGSTVRQMVDAWNKVLQDGGPMADELKANHFVPLINNMYPPLQLGLKSGKIESIADFDGKKIRVAGGPQVFSVNALHGVPVQLIAGDIYVSLQQGTVDGYFLALNSIDSYKLQEVTRSLTTNASFAGGQVWIGMDDRYLANLAPEKQTAIMDCAKQAEDGLTAYSDQMVEDLKKKYTAEGVEMYALPAPLLDELNEVLQLAIDDFVNRLTDLGLPAQEAVEQYQAALAASTQ